MLLALLLLRTESPSNTVGTATTVAAITANYQRKVFYANSYHWIFYCNGSHILYSTSQDGSTWNTPTAIREGISSSGISVLYEGGTYVYYAYASAAPSSPVVYRKGQITSDTINWENEQTAVLGVSGATYFLTNDQRSTNIWAMNTTKTTNESDTTTSIITGNHITGTYFLFQPGQETAIPLGTSLPTHCTSKGWRTKDELNTTIPEGTWSIVTRLTNRAETAHSGRICLRLWKSPEPNISQATAITNWIETEEITFSSTTSETQKTIFTQIPEVKLNNEFIFIELGWKVETPASDENTGLKLVCNEESAVTTVTYEYYNGYCSIDSNGYPWVAYFRNDGYYWESCVAKANSTDGKTWSTPDRISEPALTPWRTSILPLNDAKMIAIYATTSEVKARLWNGTWGTEENVAAIALAQDYGYSAISHDNEVHIVLLQNATYNIIYFRRSSETGWLSQVIQTNQSATSFPVLTVDKSTGNLYCFWANKKTLYMKKCVNNTWEDSNTFASASNSPRMISCSYQVWEKKIGVAWIEESNNLFKVMYRFLSLQSETNGNFSGFYLYATQGCEGCEEQIQILEKLNGKGSVVFYGILDNINMQHYRKIVDTLADKGIIDPSDPIRGIIPLSGFFQNGSLKTIIFGRMPEENWKRIINASNASVSIYFLGETAPAKTIQDQAVVTTISGHFDQTAPLTSDYRTENFFVLLILVSLLAAADAINPCELNAFLLLLVYVFYHVGKKAVLKVGLVFSSAVFITYYLMGLGLLRVFQGVPFLKLAIAAFGLIVGALEVTAFLGIERKHIPGAFTTKIKTSLERAVNPYTAFLAGVAVSLLLLPCTSGPYFITIELMAQKTTLLGGLILLTAYNAIVVAPFLVVTLIIYTLTFKTSKLRRWITEKERWLRLFAGMTMIFISLMMIVL
jgi:cytochrome c biogenesis protein CcdA